VENYQKLYRRLLETYEPPTLHFSMLGHNVKAFPLERDKLLAELNPPPIERHDAMYPPRQRFPEISLMVFAVNAENWEIEPDKLFDACKQAFEDSCGKHVCDGGKDQLSIMIGDCGFVMYSYYRTLGCRYINVSLVPSFGY
jgi:hypothetical protein